MKVTFLLSLRFEPVKAHRFTLAVSRRTPRARPVGPEGDCARRLPNREYRTDMVARSCVCHRSRSHSLEQYGPTHSHYQGNGREGTP